MGKKKLVYDYACNRCGNHETNHTLSCFLCNCGGDYIHIDKQLLQPIVFDAYFDPTVDKYLTSYRQQEKEGLKYRSVQHPEGFKLVNENKKFMNEMKYIRKHKQDYIKAQYAKDTRNDRQPATIGKRTFSFAV